MAATSNRRAESDRRLATGDLRPPGSPMDFILNTSAVYVIFQRTPTPTVMMMMMTAIMMILMPLLLLLVMNSFAFCGFCGFWAINSERAFCVHFHVGRQSPRRKESLLSHIVCSSTPHRHWHSTTHQLQAIRVTFLSRKKPRKKLRARRVQGQPQNRYAFRFKIKQFDHYMGYWWWGSVKIIKCFIEIFITMLVSLKYSYKMMKIL